MKPFLFLAFVIMLIVVTLAVKGCNAFVAPVEQRMTAARTETHEDFSLASIPSFSDWRAKPEAGTPFAGTSKKAASTVTAPDPNSVVASYRSPAMNLERVDEAYLSHVTGHLDIAMYSFTDQYLADVVVQVANRGVPVRIYRDQQQYRQEVAERTRASQILASCPNIHIRVKGSPELMHIKGWSDGRMLRDGSANWSPGGEMQQDNTLVLTTDRVSVRDFETDFEAMWNRPTNTVVK